MKRTLTPLMIFGIMWLAVVAVSWFFFDGWRESPNGIWTLLGLSAVGVLAFLKGGLDFFKTFNDLTKPDEPKPKDPAPAIKIENPTGNIQAATGDGSSQRQASRDCYEHVEIHEAPKPPSTFSLLHQLPPPPADFTGRDQLIADLLKDFKAHKGATISGLTGMGGIGKTVLGYAVANHVIEKYPDAQLILDLKGTTTPLSAMDIARYVIVNLEPGFDVRGLDESNFQAAYQSVLHGKKVFLFFDNARSADQIAKLTPPETCAMLVTSRWTFSVAGLQTHKVGVMEEKEAIDFLLELCSRIGDKATELATACGRLPLALRIAGSFLQVNSQWKVEKYLAELKSAKGRLETLKSSRLSAELTAEPDVLATFELSYNGLQDDQKKNWRALGVFPASFASSAAAAMWETEIDETENLLGLFLRYSLIDFNETSSRYELHDLLAEFARGQMTEDEEQETRLKHAQHYQSLLTTANQLYLEGGEKVILGLQLLDKEWAHIQTGQTLASKLNIKDASAMHLCMNYPRAYHILDLRLHPRQNIIWLEMAILCADHNKEKIITAELNGVLGQRFRSLGEVRKAIEYFNQTLSTYKEIEDLKNQGVCLNSLGIAYTDLGEVHKAIEFYEQALLIVRKIGDRRSEGGVLGNLGVAYINLDQVHKAIEFYEQQLLIIREIGDRRSEGGVLGNLGNAYINLGQAHKAIEFYEQALLIIREIGDRYGEGATLGSLGNAYADLGEASKAMEFHERALLIVREIGDRRSEGGVLGNLGNAYINLGQARKAIEFYEQALVIARDIGDRRGEGNALGNLGSAYKNLGEVRKAIEFHEQALVIARDIGDRRGEGVILANLGNAYADLGEARKTVEFYEQALVIARDIGDRRNEGNLLGNLGIAYQNLGEARKAVEFYEQALVIARDIGDRRGEGNALGNLGSAYKNLGEKEKARGLWLRALAIYRAIESPHVKTVENWLAELDE